MPIKIIPHAPEWTEAVLAFNRRMADGGSPWGFYPEPVPDWIPRVEGAPAWREYHLAVEDERDVRAGYALKPQLWRIGGKDDWVTDWQGPFTEAAIDPRYSALGLRIIRDMLRKYPLLFSFGHGGNDEPIVRLLRSMGWTLQGTPICIRVLRPFRFLRGNRYLRRTRGQRVLSALLAYSGAGWIGTHVLQGLRRLRYHPRRFRSRARVVDSFGDWADDLWAAHKDEYACLAYRNRAMMNALLPSHGWPGGTRLLIEQDDKVIGWAVVYCKQMEGDHRFGDLRVGLVADCFGAPAAAPEIVAAAHGYLKGLKPDLIVSNQAHPSWVAGFAANGFVVLRNKRLFAISPQLKERLEPFEKTAQGLHLTNLDGHGPHGFAEAPER